MVNARNNVFLLYHLHRLLHQRLVGVLDQARHLLGPQLSEVPLDHREGQLNGIVLRAVGHVVDEPEAVVKVPRPA